MSVSDIACLYFISGVHSKKTLLQNMPSLDVPFTATLGRVNETSFPEMLSVVITNCVALLMCLVKGMKGALLHSTTRNMQVFRAHRQAAKLLFMRCMRS